MQFNKWFGSFIQHLKTHDLCKGENNMIQKTLLLFGFSSSAYTAYKKYINNTNDNLSLVIIDNNNETCIKVIENDLDNYNISIISEDDLLPTIYYNTIYMKGSWNTQKFMRFILKLNINKNFLFHSAIFFDKNTNNIKFVMSDGAINIYPNIAQKIKMIKENNELLKQLNIIPYFGLITPSGEFNLKINSSVNGYNIKKLLEQEGYNIEVGSFDTLVDIENAKNKGLNFKNTVNCLICDNLDQANTLWKSLTIFGNFNVAGLVMGMDIPIILTSRNDSIESKLLSIEIAMKQLEITGIKDSCSAPLRFQIINNSEEILDTFECEDYEEMSIIFKKYKQDNPDLSELSIRII